jgi:hypothetical protein
MLFLCCPRCVRYRLHLLLRSLWGKSGVRNYWKKVCKHAFSVKGSLLYFCFSLATPEQRIPGCQKVLLFEHLSYQSLRRLIREVREKTEEKMFEEKHRSARSKDLANLCFCFLWFHQKPWKRIEKSLLPRH